MLKENNFSEPLIAHYIYNCFDEGWEVNVKFVVALIDLGYDVNKQEIGIEDVLTRVFIRQGYSSELFEFLQERGAWKL